MSSTSWSAPDHVLLLTPRVAIPYRGKVVIYDLTSVSHLQSTGINPQTQCRRTCCKTWYYYRLPVQALNISQLSQESTFLFLTAGDNARNKLVFVPDTLNNSTMYPCLASLRYFIPHPLTHNGANSRMPSLRTGVGSPLSTFKGLEIGLRQVPRDWS